MSGELYRRSDSAIFSEVGSDVVALHVERGQCFGMEKTTAAIWRLLERPISLEDLCAQLTEDYDVSLEECLADVSRIIEQMRGEGLVETAPADAG